MNVGGVEEEEHRPPPSRYRLPATVSMVTAHIIFTKNTDAGDTSEAQARVVSSAPCPCAFVHCLSAAAASDVDPCRGRAFVHTEGSEGRAGPYHKCWEIWLVSTYAEQQKVRFSSTFYNNGSQLVGRRTCLNNC